MLAQALSLVLLASSAAALAIERAEITDFNSTSPPIAWAYPEGRGFASNTSTTAPCGGFKPGNRTSFPLSNGDIALTQRTELDNVVFLYTNESDPVRFHSFSTYTNTLSDLGAGHYCSKAPDFESLGFKAGDDATLLMIFQLDGASTYYYQCADVSLVANSDYTAPTDEYVCGNYTSTLKEASSEESMHLGSTASNSSSSSGHGSSGTGTQTNSTTGSTTGQSTGQESSAASAAAQSDNGLSAAAGGGIGAAVTIVVLAFIAAVAYFFGFLNFGKRRAQRAATGDDASSNSGLPTTIKAQH